MSLLHLKRRLIEKSALQQRLGGSGSGSASSDPKGGRIALLKAELREAKLANLQLKGENERLRAMLQEANGRE